MPDLAALITVHSETTLAGPSFASADAAIARAEAEGFTVERHIGFDTPQPGVRDFYEQPIFDAWQKHAFSFRDQGQTRTALANLSTATWLAFLDADDLWSENWLCESAAMLRQADPKTIIHPEFNWFFEGHDSVLILVEPDDPLFIPEHFYFANYYDALCMAPRAAYTEHPYGIRDVKAGYALEDWQWSLETFAAGWAHVIAKDTIIFKRRQRESQTTRAARAKTVVRNFAPMRIDRIEDLVPKKSA